MKIYLTQEYDRPYATVNSLWAAARQKKFVPDQVYVLSPNIRSPLALRTVAMLEALQAGLGREPRVEAVPITPDDLESTRSVIEEFILDAREQHHEIALDVTPGRTLPKMAAMLASTKVPPHRVFYLSVKNYDYRPLPYLLIPRRLQECKDLTGATRRD